MSTLVEDRLAIRARGALVGRPGFAERTAFVLGFTVLVAARMPGVALHGRMWAEEGTAFMRNAIVLPWSEAVVNPVGGYLNLVANLAGIVAVHLVPLEQASRVGVLTGLLFQAVPAILIVSSGFNWLQTRISILATLLLIATIPLADEVWLNSLHPQFHLTLCAAFILAMDPARGWTGWLHLLLILLAALCGPTTWFLLPLFAGRAVMERSWPRTVQGTVLAVGIVLQAALFFSADQTKHSTLNMSALVSSLLLKDLLTQTLDYQTVDAFAGGLRTMALAGTVSPVIAMFEAVAIGLGGALLWLRGPKALFWTFAASVVIAVPSYAAARGGTINLLYAGSGNRYAFVPQVLFALVLLGIATTSKGGIGWLVRGGIVWLLAIGIAEFYYDPIRDGFTEGPRWADEVAAWRQDPTHLVRLWPESDIWTLDLNPPPSTPH
jgi:hypothetical protein